MIDPYSRLRHTLSFLTWPRITILTNNCRSRRMQPLQSTSESRISLTCIKTEKTVARTFFFFTFFLPFTLTGNSGEGKKEGGAREGRTGGRKSGGWKSSQAFASSVNVKTLCTLVMHPMKYAWIALEVGNGIAQRLRPCIAWLQATLQGRATTYTERVRTLLSLSLSLALSAQPPWTRSFHRFPGVPFLGNWSNFSRYAEIQDYLFIRSLQVFPEPTEFRARFIFFILFLFFFSPLSFVVFSTFPAC